MFAGLASLDGTRLITEEMRVQLRAALSRFPGEHIHSHSTPSTFIVRANVSALSSHPGLYVSAADGVSVLAGEPLGPENDVGADLETIHKGMVAGTNTALAACCGVFCGARCLEEKGGAVVELFADKLAVRPLYYWVEGTLVAFATALRILEQLPFVSKKRDEAGLVQTVGFGYPLSNRTQYDGIRVVREGEIVRISRSGMSASRYWRWDSVHTHRDKPADAPIVAFDLLQAAVKRRLGNDQSAVAFLSGGMDSRAVASAVQTTSTSIVGVNFSPARSQDQAFAKAYAHSAGIKLLELEVPEILSGRYDLALAHQVRSHVDAGKLSATRPCAPWSGDGGSVGLGNVYLDDELVRLMRSGNEGAAITRFFQQNHVELPLGVVKANRRAELQSMLLAGMAQELARQECDDRGQALLLFLMTNDQRRHLHPFYEDLDLHRLEYQLPLMDSDLLRFVFSLPVEYRNNHRFYTEWYEAFPAPVRAVPWQTYPGHVPCPIPAPDTLSYQWSPKKRTLRERLRSRLASSRKALLIVTTSRDTGPISRTRLCAAACLQLAGGRDYSWTLTAAETLIGQDL